MATCRSHNAYTRPAGPITATVYPLPQNIPTSPSVHMSSAPTQSPTTRFPFNPQTPMMVRSPGQSSVQYVVNPEIMDNPTGQPLSARQRSPRVQGPPPSYSVAIARPQQQVSF